VAVNVNRIALQIAPLLLDPATDSLVSAPHVKMGTYQMLLEIAKKHRSAMISAILMDLATH